MGTLYISEFQTVQMYGQVAHAPSERDQVVAITDESTMSQPFLERPVLVLLHCDAACSIRFVAHHDGKATRSNMRMEAGQTMPYGVAPGHAIAVISNP